MSASALTTVESTALEPLLVGKVPALPQMSGPVSFAPAPIGGTPPAQVTIINQVGGGGISPLVLDAADKSPGVAAFLSLVWVGTGQLYNGEIGKGIVMFFGCIALWFALLGWIVNFWSIFDAYSVAKRKKQNWQLMLSGVGAGGQIARVGQ